MHAPWSISLPLARRLLGQSWPLLLSGFAVMTYMRIDQIMLATMLDDHAVGVFSAALRVAEVWYFIPMAITGAAFPRMLEKRTADPRSEEHTSELQSLMRNSYAVFCLKTQNTQSTKTTHIH